VTLAKAPLVPLALAFATGVALAPLAPRALAWSVWLAGLAAAPLLLARGRTAWAAAPVLAGVAALGMLRGAEPQLPPDHVGRLALPRTARVEGRIAAEPVRWAPDRARLLLDAERADARSATGRVQVTVYGEIPALAEGQRVAAQLALYPAAGFRNPGTFDYAAHLAREGVRVVATTRADRLAALDAPRPPWPARVRWAALEALGRALGFGAPA